jgi:exosortase
MGYQDFLQYLSMLIVLFGLVYANLGAAFAKIAFFPISYLIFMIPLPQLVYTNITFHLRLLSTEMAYFLIRLFGIHATRQGNIIELPTCTLVVATPCSGIRGLIVFMAASLALGYLFQKGAAKKLILFIFGIFLALLMNTLRLTLTAATVNMLKLPEVPSYIHDAYGYVVLILGLLILFGASNLLNKGEQ